MYHFFLLFLDKLIFNNYTIRYDYVRHNYILYRNSRFKLLDVFIIIRTSEKCFRLTYHNVKGIYIYKTFKSAKHCAEFVLQTFEKYKA